MSGARRRAGWIGFMTAAVLLAMVAPAGAEGGTCPAIVAKATRLMVATAGKMTSGTGHAALFERRDGAWQASGGAFPVAFGRNGLGWSFDQTGLAGAGGGRGKAEGDNRTPAGIFSAGSPFGFGASDLRDYIVIAPGTICVDDLGSPLYNKVVKLFDVPAGLSHEKMWETPLYRNGLIIENATSRVSRGGSCIFLHVWRGPGQGTAGCVAAAQANVIKVQSLFDAQSAAIAILPQASVGVLAGCGIPGIDPDAGTAH